MSSKNYIFFSAVFFLLGTLLLAYNRGWVIFRFPSYKTEVAQTVKQLRAHKKKVKLIFWHKKRWNNEVVEILKTDDAAYTLQNLVNSWLTLLDEEKIMKKKVTLQSALLSENKEAYLSFDRNPFDETDMTYAKWMWIEGLLRTIKESGIPMQNINFLVHHQPMQDYHLDFSNPWPLSGFLR